MATGCPSQTVDAVDRSVSESVGIVAGYAALSRWTEVVRQELNNVHWTWPEEVEEVLSFRLWTDGDTTMGLPALPKQSSRVVALCPFVDASVAKAIADTTAAPQRNLITTPETLAKLLVDDAVSLDAFTSVHEMASATPYEEGDTEIDENAEGEIVEIHRGLHAKLVWARSPSGDELWLGSANLTQRGWRGLNAELVAHLRVKESVGDDIAELADRLEEVTVEEYAVDDSDAEGEGKATLDNLRNRIAGCWSGELSRVAKKGALALTTSSTPIKKADGAELWVRLLAHEAGDAVAWSPGPRKVELKEVDFHELTELVVLELRWETDKNVSVSWVERAALTPPPGADRDRVALGRLMGPRAVLAWIRSILDEFSSEAEESPWPEGERVRARRGDGAGLALPPVPTLESVLRGWIRDPNRVEQVDQVLQNWAMVARPVLAEDAEAARVLRQFQEAWGVVRDGLSTPAG